MNADGSSYSSELNALTLFKLMVTFEKVMERFRISEERLKHTVVQFPFTIEEERDNIRRLIRMKDKVGFLDIFSQCQTRMHACFIFLALLDLLQANAVSIVINEGFNNFHLTEYSSESIPAE
jgi:segregation and condensation protein A